MNDKHRNNKGENAMTENFHPRGPSGRETNGTGGKRRSPVRTVFSLAFSGLCRPVPDSLLDTAVRRLLRAVRAVCFRRAVRRRGFLPGDADGIRLSLRHALQGVQDARKNFLSERRSRNAQRQRTNAVHARKPARNRSADGLRNGRRLRKRIRISRQYRI